MSPCKIKNNGLFLNSENVLVVGLNYIFNAIVMVETGQKVIVFCCCCCCDFTPDNTKGSASSLLYASFTCASPLTLVKLVLIYTRVSSHIKRSYMPTSGTE